ncbi:MAG TPA: hypothetical protein VGP88_00480 [Thermoplasmata archaeon]|jgi:hypothetical protein|nr:hypothetical protein [Thermoplasmata archaeon]
MREEPAGLALLVLGGILAAAAIAATVEPGVGTALAATGAALAGAGVLLLVSPAVRHRGPTAPDDPVGSSLVLLREAFRSGPLGRQAIIASVVSLEQGTTGATLRRLDPEEERRLVASDPAAFRAWLDQRLTRLEQET